MSDWLITTICVFIITCMHFWEMRKLKKHTTGLYLCINKLMEFVPTHKKVEAMLTIQKILKDFNQNEKCESAKAPNKVL